MILQRLLDFFKRSVSYKSRLGGLRGSRDVSQHECVYVHLPNPKTATTCARASFRILGLGVFLV